MIKYDGSGPDRFYDETHEPVIATMLVVFGVVTWGALALLWQVGAL